jgi:L-ascorbate metabolism protein UlaG (beta-lactamase superfamily)
MPGITCTVIGHSTTLTQLDGTSILTDAHFGPRVFLSPRRTELKIDHALLDKVNAVLISHMHYDHLHLNSFKFIGSGIPVIVPEHTEKAVGPFVSNPVIELAHWATHELTDGTTITALPLHHRGGRLSQLRYTSSNAYLVDSGGMRMFFCGDSAYGPSFKEIGALYDIDAAYIPIGCYEPRWFMKKRHMTPAEAVNAFEELQAKNMIPIHYGTFRLSFEPLDAPKKWLEKICKERPDLAKRIHCDNIGARIELNCHSDRA